MGFCNVVFIDSLRISCIYINTFIISTTSPELLPDVPLNHITLQSSCTFFLKKKKTHCILFVQSVAIWVWPSSRVWSTTRRQTFEETDSPCPSNHQLPISQLMRPTPLHPCWNVDWVGFVQVLCLWLLWVYEW